MKTMEEHTFRPYDRELNQLRQTVLEMGRAVERQVEKAVEGVRKGDQALFDEVLQTERSINEEDRRVFEQSVQLIVRNQHLVGFDLVIGQRTLHRQATAVHVGRGAQQPEDPAGHARSRFSVARR